MTACPAGCARKPVPVMLYILGKEKAQDTQSMRLINRYVRIAECVLMCVRQKLLWRDEMKTNKFRSWDKINKKYYYLVGFILTGTQYRIWYYEWDENECDNILVNQSFYVDNLIIEQFTGLHDINGKEIYEGDIAVAGGDIIGIIVFEDGGFYFDTIDEIDCDFLCNLSVEITGNIHENPELLS